MADGPAVLVIDEGHRRQQLQGRHLGLGPGLALIVGKRLCPRSPPPPTGCRRRRRQCRLFAALADAVANHVGRRLRRRRQVPTRWRSPAARVLGQQRGVEQRRREQLLVNLPLFIVRPFRPSRAPEVCSLTASQRRRPEPRDPEPLRRLASPIRLSKRMTIGETLSCS